MGVMDYSQQQGQLNGDQMTDAQRMALLRAQGEAQDAQSKANQQAYGGAAREKFGQFGYDYTSPFYGGNERNYWADRQRGVDLSTNDYVNSLGVRNAQTAQLDRLQGLANGTAPSIASMQYGANLGNALAQQQAMAASARGGNYAGAQRMAMMNAANMGQAGARDAAMAQLAERMQAEQALTGAANAARGQDLGSMGQWLGYQQGVEGGQLQSSTGGYQAGLAKDASQYAADTARQKGFLDYAVPIAGMAGGAAAGFALGGPPGAVAGGAAGSQLTKNSQG